MSNKAQIKTQIEEAIETFWQWAKDNPDQLAAATQNNMVGCVTVQRVSPCRSVVGWRFAAAGTQAGDIQRDPHFGYDRDIKIVWVAPDVTDLKRQVKALAQAEGWTELVTITMLQALATATKNEPALEALCWLKRDYIYA